MDGPPGQAAAGQRAAGDAAWPADPTPRGVLLRQLLWLSLPVMAEHLLHMFVGLTDTYLANRLPQEAARASATAAVGTIAYILWFVGLIVGTIGTGSMAIIARAIGARHRSLANSVTGQSITAALAMGVLLGLVMYAGADLIVGFTQLKGDAPRFARDYLRLLAVAMPFSTLMFTANSCLRGAGDTLTPAISMILVDLVNIFCSFGLTYGWWGFPAMGFHGIALGTVIAFVTGGLLQFSVLVWGRRGVRLFLHRLRPHWLTLKRVLRIGLPAGTESLLTWVAQFLVVIVINWMDPTNVASAAHINAIRIEAISFMVGLAVATAAATMVGQSLGMGNPRRARRSAYWAYALGGSFMTICGIVFIFFGQELTSILTPDPRLIDLTGQCLFVAGFVQSGFAASGIFAGALRGAGDTYSAMVINLISIIGVRLVGVLVVGWWLELGLVAVWIVLCAELMVRGALVYMRFAQGQWRHAKV